MTLTRSLAVAALTLTSAGAFAEEGLWKGADQPYLQAAHERVHRRWLGFLQELARLPRDSPYHNPALQVELLLTVEADGTISHVERTRVSGLKGFDDAPLDLFHDMATLPPPPPAIRSDDGRAYVMWRFIAHEPGCEERSVTERRLPLAEAVPKLVADGRTDQAAMRVSDARRSEPAHEADLVMLLGGAVARVEARSPDALHRAAAAAVLGHLDDGEKLLLPLAADADPSVRKAALLALGVRRKSPLDPRARDLLMKALRTDDGVEAAVALGRSGEHSAVEPLRTMLAAAGEVQGVGAPEAAVALVALNARTEAIAAVDKLLAGDVSARRAGARAARALALPEMTPAIAMAIAAPGSDEATRIALVEALAVDGVKGSSDGRRAVLGRLRDPSAKVRARALEALGTFGDRSGAMRTRLVDALVDTAPEARAAAAASLVRVGGAQNADEVARAARDPRPLVRAAIAAALRAHPYEGSRNLLGRLEKDADASVRAAATSVAAPLVKLERARIADRMLAETDLVELLRAAAAYLDAPG